MIIFEFSKEDMEYADKIADLAEMSTIVVAPKSVSSQLNDIVQIGVQLAPYAISAVTFIIIEMIKNAKKVKIKVADGSFEVEGLSAEKSIELAMKYLEQQQEDKAKEVLNQLLRGGKGGNT